MAFATGGHHVGAKALVIFYVTLPGVLSLAVKLIKQVAGVLTQDVDQHVQTATVWHANHDFFTTFATRTLDDLIHHRDHGFAAFQTEALNARITRGQVVFHPFSGR